MIKTFLKQFCLSFRMSSLHLRLNHTGSGNLPPRPTWCSVQQWGPSRRRWECLRRRASSAHCCLTEAIPGKSAFLFSPSKHHRLASSRRIVSSRFRGQERGFALQSLLVALLTCQGQLWGLASRPATTLLCTGGTAGTPQPLAGNQVCKDRRE